MNNINKIMPSKKELLRQASVATMVRLSASHDRTARAQQLAVTNIGTQVVL